MNTFNLHIHTAERDFFNGEARSLIIPRFDGQYGIQAHHFNGIMAIVPGTMELTDAEGNKIYAVLSQGMIKIEDNEVLVLVDTALTREELEEYETKREKEDEMERKLQELSSKEFLEAEAAMRRAIYKLKNRNGSDRQTLQ